MKPNLHYGRLLFLRGKLLIWWYAPYHPKHKFWSLALLFSAISFKGGTFVLPVVVRGITMTTDTPNVSISLEKFRFIHSRRTSMASKWILFVRHASFRIKADILFYAKRLCILIYIIILLRAVLGILTNRRSFPN